MNPYRTGDTVTLFGQSGLFQVTDAPEFDTVVRVTAGSDEEGFYVEAFQIEGIA